MVTVVGDPEVRYLALQAGATDFLVRLALVRDVETRLAC
jgi:hypothetical protein